MQGFVRRSAIAGIVAVGLAAACRDAPAPAADQTAAPSTRQPSRSLSVGDPAPEFSLPGSDGKQYSLASYRGRQPVVLVWFSKAFTEG
jgi:hypothetical protein